MAEVDPDINPVPAVAETKTIFTSKVFWGVIVSLIAAALNKWGKKMDLDTQNAVVDMILTMITGGAGLFAVYGRIAATQPASLTGGQEKIVDIKRVLPFLLIPLLLLAGCQSNPFQKRATNDTPLTNDSRVIYAGIVNEMTTLKRAGYFTDAEWKGEIKDLRDQAGKIFESMEASELLAQQSVLEASAASLKNILDALIEWRLKANTRKSIKVNTATRPVSFRTSNLAA